MKRIQARWLFRGLSVTACFAVSVIGTARFAMAEFEVLRVASNISQPVYVTQAPGDPSRLFIVEAQSGYQGGPQTARIKILNLTGPNAGTVNSTPFLELSGIDQREDQGMFGLAFHPNYAENGVFYLNYATGYNGGTSNLYRYQVSAGDPNVANPAGTLMLSYFKPYYNHNGDWLGFKPGEADDGKYYLYHTTGDGGDNLDPGDRAQNLSLPYGKILRFDVGADGTKDDFPADATKNYGIPIDNPGYTEPLVWDYGLRNPWRASFDRETSDLYIGNVGADLVDEVEIHRADQPGGVNFGWSRREGTSPGPNPNPPIVGYQNPIYQFNATSLTGGYVYRGLADELQGHYFFADFLGSVAGNNQIFSLQYNGADPTTFNGTNIIGGVPGGITNRTAQFVPDDGNTINYISSFGEDNFGNLYIIDMGNLGTPTSNANKPGEIYKVFPVIDEITLTIDRDTGEMTWSNPTGAPVGLASYEIVSARGAINPASVVEITGNYDTGGNGLIDGNDAWQVTSSTFTKFAERSTGDAGGLGAGSMFNAGNAGAWVQSIYEDLKAFVVLGDGNSVLADVNFIGNSGVPFGRSDLNFNGDLDPGDWDTFRENHDQLPGGLTAAQAYAMGDLDGDGDNDFFDFRIFKADYIAMNGAAAFAGLAGSNIPEPSTCLLALAAIIGLSNARRKR